jgi:hypothetical protein
MEGDCVGIFVGVLIAFLVVEDEGFTEGFAETTEILFQG